MGARVCACVCVCVCVGKEGRDYVGWWVLNTLAPTLSHTHAEKNLAAIKTMMKSLPPNARMAFVGDGPQRAELEEHFRGDNVVFMVRVKMGDGTFVCGCEWVDGGERECEPGRGRS